MFVATRPRHIASMTREVIYIAGWQVPAEPTMPRL